MNGKQILEVKTEVCTELNKMEFKYDMIRAYFDIDPSGLTMSGLSACLKDMGEREDSKISDYELVITGIKVNINKKI